MNNESFIPALVPPCSGDGSAGTTFTPTVSSDGVLSWTNDGGKENPEPVNIKGPPGSGGKDGTIFTPSVSESGDLSWTNDGGKENPDQVNIRGPAGENGEGVPTGGTAGQFLKKASSTDYDTQWTDLPEGVGDITYLVRAPVGAIVIWSGTADNIPTGWQLCDGTNGTPDLRDKFVLGAGISHSVGETGGSEEVTLTVEQMPQHTHSATNYTGNGGSRRMETQSQYNFFVKYSESSANIHDKSGDTGNSKPHPNMPPYYTLCYIMKLTVDPNDSVTVEEMSAAIDEAKPTQGDGITIRDSEISVTTPVRSVLTQAEYDALPDEQKSSGLYVISDGGCVESSGGEIYSTTERRIGTWIDGKPLYRKTYSVDNLSVFTENGVERSFIQIGDTTKTVVNAYGPIYSSSRSSIYGTFPWTALTFASSSGIWGIGLKSVNNATFVSTIKGNSTSTPGVAVSMDITVEYTKTADEPEVTS